MKTSPLHNTNRAPVRLKRAPNLRLEKSPNLRLKLVPDKVGNLSLQHVASKRLEKAKGLVRLKQAVNKGLSFISIKLKKSK